MVKNIQRIKSYFSSDRIRPCETDFADLLVLHFSLIRSHLKFFNYSLWVMFLNWHYSRGVLSIAQKLSFCTKIECIFQCATFTFSVVKSGWRHLAFAINSSMRYISENQSRDGETWNVFVSKCQLNFVDLLDKRCQF